MNLKSKFLQEFFDRGYLAQCTDIQGLDNILASQKINAYIGFDCTAPSLHAGSLIQIMILRYLQKCGHTPIVLLGGGTTKIGDPSGKDEARQILDENAIAQNIAGIRQTLEKFDLSKTDSTLKPFQFVNNDDWLKDLKYIDFLRDFGRHFSVNRMLSFESVKIRLDRQQSLSFLEFNYMILQAYDFYKLNADHNCVLQIGGSDQWGNIVNGVELTRRKNIWDDLHDPKVAKTIYQTEDELNTAINVKEKSAFGLTTPLLTTSDGKKMGKTANGAVWLSNEMLDEFEYFQYFRNVDDKDVLRFLKLFTELSLEEILEIEQKDINEQKKILAFEATKICHSLESAKQCEEKAEKIFSNKADNIEDLPQINLDLTSEELQNGKNLAIILKEQELCASTGEARRLIKGGGVKINDEKIVDESYALKFNNEMKHFKLGLGKKKFFKVNISSK